MILAAVAVIIGLEIQTTPRYVCLESSTLDAQVTALAKAYHFSRFGPALAMHSEAFCPDHAVTANEALAAILGPLGLTYDWYGKDSAWLGVHKLQGHICDPDLEDSPDITLTPVFPCVRRPVGFKWVDHDDLRVGDWPKE